MTIQDFVALPNSKYLILGASIWEQDEVAKTVAPSPRTFELNGVSYTIISLDPMSIEGLTAYMVSQGGEYEFGFTQGNGKASFLTHAQAIELLTALDVVE